MFQPNFRYTNKIVNNLTQIAAARELILNSPLIPKWEVSLRTGWLEYFTDGVAVSIKAVKDKVVGLSKDIKLLKEKGQIVLTERQMKIVERIIQNNKVTIGEVSKEFGITRQASLKEINKLVRLKVVKLMGKGRGAYYILV